MRIPATEAVARPRPARRRLRQPKPVPQPSDRTGPPPRAPSALRGLAINKESVTQDARRKAAPR